MVSIMAVHTLTARSIFLMIVLQMYVFYVYEKLSKDIGMGVRKGTVVSFVPTLFGCFLGIPSLYVCSFF